ncbi:MAG: hypothetical protein U1F20_01195 [Lysobacterales bacterium]
MLNANTDVNITHVRHGWSFLFAATPSSSDPAGRIATPGRTGNRAAFFFADTMNQPTLATALLDYQYSANSTRLRRAAVALPRLQDEALLTLLAMAEHAAAETRPRPPPSGELPAAPGCRGILVEPRRALRLHHRGSEAEAAFQRSIALTRTPIPR